MTEPTIRTTVTNKIAEGEDAWLLSFESKHPFTAGQVIGITTSPNLPPRLYSIASGESDTEMSIFFNVKKEGDLTPKLATLIPGDHFFVTPPHGSFVHDGDPSWWIATGTGIAPFRSMFQSGIAPQKLIQGARTDATLYFEKEFSTLNNYITCLTQQERLNRPIMRLTQYLTLLDEVPPQLKYYLCGNSNMVVDVREILLSRGVPFKNIITEIYF